MNEVKIDNIQPEHAAALERLQRTCFPTLAEDELMTEEHFRSHCEIFPEGDFVALTDGKVVGLGSGFFTDFDFQEPGHTFQEMIADGYYTNHDPEGDYYYGADISVHPEHRGQGIGTRLYDARKNLVKRYNRHGIVAGGLLPGYGSYKEHLTVREYVDRVVAGRLTDPTLSFQLKQGFTVLGLLENYIEDRVSDNWATLLVWPNPEF